MVRGECKYLNLPPIVLPPPSICMFTFALVPSFVMPRRTLAQVKAHETEQMRRRTEQRIAELMRDEGAQPNHFMQLMTYGLIWYIIYMCSAFFLELHRQSK